MTIVLLPGNSVSNREWLNRLAERFKKDFELVIPHAYRHWETGEALIDLQEELKRLTERIPVGQRYTIVAKSAGVILTMKGIFERVLSPTFCVFIGTPIPWANAEGILDKRWFQKSAIAILFIQNERDPIMNLSALRQFLGHTGLSNYRISPLPGRDHDYTDLDRLVELTAAFSRGELDA